MGGDSGDIHGASLTTAQRKVRDMLLEYRSRGFIGGRNFAAGRNEGRMTRFAEANGIKLASKSFYMGPKSLAHSMRASKAKKGLAVADRALVGFIGNRSKMDLYWDGESFVYTDYSNKFILHPDYEIKLNRKKARKVCFVTAGVVEHPNEFMRVGRYVKVT